ncbi:MAG: (2Fe-2S)-binding protein [Christensenellaceae bacterium]|jgi:predicted molibdopterin-dependent oxidoreductase YjgC|nr:(2Fe-2S)-binding protein [Christensenellaceae bacterium]
MRIYKHPILEIAEAKIVTVYMDSQPIIAHENDSIAAALIASGISVFRHTHKTGEPRGVFCGIGQCADCLVIVNGQPNVRACVTLVKEGMQIQSQSGYGQVGTPL